MQATHRAVFASFVVGAVLLNPGSATADVPFRLTAATAASVGTEGFAFDYLMLGAGVRFGDHVSLQTLASARLEDVEVDHAAVGFDGMPWDLAIRIGRLRTRFGLANERHQPESWFSDGQLAMTRAFGPDLHEALGLDLAFVVPAPWTLRLWFGMFEAGGAGQRSAFGDAAPRIDGLEDFAWSAGLENVWEAGDARIHFDLHGVFAPNPSGRANGTDVFGAALAVIWRPDPDDVGVGVETEWLLRRRQVIADVLQDVGGWVQANVWIDAHWSVAGRWDFTQGLDEGDPLDPADLADRYRARLHVQWNPHSVVAVRLQGTADAGGPHEDPQFSGMIHVRAGLSHAHAEEDH